MGNFQTKGASNQVEGLRDVTRLNSRDIILIIEHLGFKLKNNREYMPKQMLQLIFDYFKSFEFDCFNKKIIKQTYYLTFQSFEALSTSKEFFLLTHKSPLSSIYSSVNVKFTPTSRIYLGVCHRSLEQKYFPIHYFLSS